MKRQPKRPKPPSASELKAEERQRMISSDLEQIRGYIGEIARILKGYREENVRLRAEVDVTRRATEYVNGVNEVNIVHLVGERDRLRLALEHYGRHYEGEGMERAGWCHATRLVPPDYKRHGECTCGLSAALGATHASEGQAAAQLLRPQDFAAELPADD